MKKVILLFLIFIGISTASIAQSAGKGSAESSSGKRKSRSQMFHFDRKKKDPNIKHNGTSYRKSQKSQYNVDGDGFSTAKQGKVKRRRRKK